jgi:hypothetical protein
MAVLTLPTGAKVKTYPPPPDGLDPLAAAEHMMRQHGLPRRPADPRLAARWEAGAGRINRYIVPTFVPHPGKYHGPLRRAADATETSNNWSGGVLFAPSGKVMKWVHGEWRVPNPDPATTDGTLSYCSSWVGIDGDGSADVLQAGTECEARSVNGQVQRTIYAWWEWFPEAEVAISNFPVAAGDLLTCTICVEDGSTTKATVFLSNQTQGTSTSFEITAPTGTSLSGNCAEWIVERPSVGGVVQGLARYGTVSFANTSAALTDGSGGTLDGATGDNINMTDGGQTISTGQLIPPEQIRCTRD